MAKYEVNATFEGWHMVEVEADSLEEALELGEQMLMNGEGEEIGGEWSGDITADLLEEEED